MDPMRRGDGEGKKAQNEHHVGKKHDKKQQGDGEQAEQGNARKEGGCDWLYCNLNKE
jgi:hypothetical protein